MFKQVDTGEEYGDLVLECGKYKNKIRIGI